MTKKIPEIRFDGFDGEWEEVKIKDIADVKAGGDINKSKLRDTGRYPVIGNGITKDSSIIGYYEDEYKVKAPAVTLTGRGDIGVPIARNVSFTPVVRLLSLKFQDQYNVYFMANSLSNVNFLKETTGVPQLTSISVKNYKIKITSPPEQEKIGSLFEKIDSLIEGQERAVDSYKGLKKSLLQKMFPKEGEKIPQIRFPGFDGEWEEIRIKNLIDKYGSGGTPKSTNKSYYNGDIPFLSITDITNSNGKIYETEKHISKDGLNNSSAWIVPKGSISLAMYASVGKVAILEIDSATSQAFFNMIVNKNTDLNFLFQYFIKMEMFNEWRKLISKGTQSNLNAKKIKGFKIKVPSIPEQEKIGSFFKKLDNLIEDEEKYLEDLKVLKKSLLQKMFV